MERESILLIHTITGIIIFISGLLQILLKKGGKIHKILGNVYLYSWFVVLISGAYLGGFLITIVGIFGFYFALTGSRIGKLKNSGITIFEKSTFIFGGLLAIVMLGYAINLFIKGSKSYWIIFAVFGGIFTFVTVQDIFKYVLLKPLKKQIYGQLDWYFEHFTRMFISFIAATTAFVSIQDLFGNTTMNFIMPTIIGTIMIFFSTKFYKKKLNIEK
ncbi:hypothetical protein PXC01_00580 [Maribacter sp. M208]|uniref:hypothetical protein n=1 Tax=Maribacter huludaoensis TaxID=3030010 RepID=UPI0023EC4289|nr:hypothetical protein [Maribacter huludaoensis]MDF4220060.1 hypothetical protein [Maribacter huludaoensis]